VNDFRQNAAILVLKPAGECLPVNGFRPSVSHIAFRISFDLELVITLLGRDLNQAPPNQNLCCFGVLVLGIWITGKSWKNLDVDEVRNLGIPPP